MAAPRSFGLHYGLAEARALLTSLPAQKLSALHLGAACAGFQCEGGFNGPGEPRNNWAGWEGRPGIVASGPAAGFWTRFEEDAALCSGAGLDTLRLSLEWARLQPSPSGDLEPLALARYAAILAALHAQSVQPLVTLYHWTHPAHLGADLWLDPASPARFAGYVKALLPALLDALDARGVPPPARFITVNEPNMFALATYLAGRFPHGPRTPGGRSARTCLAHLLLAHLEASRAVREVYRARGLPRPALGFNNNFSAFYRADLFWTELLFAPQKRDPRSRLEAHLGEREAHFTRAFLASEGEVPLPRKLARLALRGLEGLLRQGVKLERLEKLVGAAYAQDEPPVDFLAFDYYDPFPWNLLGGSTPGSDRGVGPVVDEWDWRPHPRGLSVALGLYAQAAPGVPVWIAENGMATRSVGPRVFPRADGARRDAFLQAHLFELLRALAEGVPVEGYLHWSLRDNYEWGSYQPRFGLLGLDRSGLDAAGQPSLAAYAALARAARAGDAEALAHALCMRGE